MSLLKFESMLKTNNVYFFDLVEFEEIIIHYLDAGKHALAKKAVKLGLEQHPNSIDLKLLQVELFIFEDKLDQANQMLHKIEILEPHNEEVFIQKATILSKQKHHDEAIECLKKSLEFVEDKSEIWSLIAMEYLYLDNFENARLNFAKCIDVDYEDYSALYNIVYCFDMENDHESAIRYLNSYIDRNPYCEVAWHQLGRQYYILDMFKEALTAFDYAVLIDENFIGGYLEKAKTLEELSRYEEAIANYKVTLDLDDPTAFAFVRIGNCYQMLNDYDAALQFYKKAVNEDPLLDKAWIALTDIYFQLQNFEKASYYIEKAIKIDDENAVYWRKYAEINLKLSLFEESVNGFQKCLDLNDDSIEIFIGLIDVLCFLGEYNESLLLLREAQVIYKDFAEIEYRFAGIFFILKKDKYALSHLINGLKIDYDYHHILNELFPAFCQQKKIEELLQYFKKALD